MKGKIVRYAVYITIDTQSGEEALVDECRSPTQAEESKECWERFGWETRIEDRGFSNLMCT